jgi:conjugal transfer ATP-binding protein TraC
MKKKLDAATIAAEQKAREQSEVEQAFLKGVTTLRDLIAPSSLEIHSSYFRLGTKYCRTLYIYGYPRQIYTGWLSSLINIDQVIDVSMFIYPVESQVILDNLRKKVTQLEASIMMNNEKGRTRDPGIQAAISDAEELRDQIQVGAEKFFRYGLYVTLYADSLDELSFVQHTIETLFGQQMVFSKVASSQQEQGLNSTIPQMTDQLQIRRNMNTGAISTSFPFTSADLTQENGVLYGINMHNNGLVIFDRFSLENANMVVFAKSGAGKSFTVKLEALRSMMIGSEIIIIDPENEYEKLATAVGGSYIRLSLGSNTRINPFDLPKVVDVDESDNALRANLITLHGLLKLMLGGTQVTSNGATVSALAPSEEADLDQALIDTYARVGITSDPLTHNSQPPTIADLYDTLLHMGATAHN